MARSKSIYISDVHLGDDARYADPQVFRRARFDPDTDGARLENFLNSYVLRNQDQVKELVLLGDIFDTWVCPFDAVPPTYDSIFNSEKNKPIMDALRNIAQTGIKVYFLNGNHDFDLGKEEIEAAIPGVTYRDRYHIDPDLETYAEHGHHYTLFNRPDYDIDGNLPIAGLPIGYFITRFSEHMGRKIKKYVRGWKDLFSYLDDFQDFLSGKDNMFVSILEGLAERCGADGVIMAPPLENITLDEIKRAYEPLGEKYNLFEAGVLSASERDLESYGDRICKEQGHKVAIFGHTHEAKIDKDSFLTDDRIYVNSGCWCGKQAHFVSIEKKQAAHVANVQVYKYEHSGNTVLVGEETI